MTTLVLPDSIVNATTDQWAPLSAFLASAKPGDVLQNPKPGAVIPCDKPLAISSAVKHFFDGATLKQLTARPFVKNLVIHDGTITNNRHLRTATLLPPTANWGYVNGVGAGECEIVLDGDRHGGTLSRDCEDGTGLTITFTGKADRGRAGFIISAPAGWEIHDVTWEGVNTTGRYVPELEGQAAVFLNGAGPGFLDEVFAKYVFGDWIYYAANGGRRTSGVQSTGGGYDTIGRSGLCPVNAVDCSVDRPSMEGCARTTLDFEPPASNCVMDRFALTNASIGRHGLELISSGGNVGAHVGALTFSRNEVHGAPMTLWLIAGTTGHRRGPYTIVGNDNSGYTGDAFGASYPTAAMVSIENALGATVRDNRGIRLQSGRTPPMAFLRSRVAGIVDVGGNTVVGGVESGPWI